MAAKVLDEFVTVYGFTFRKDDVGRMQGSLDRIRDKTLAVGRGLRTAAAASGAFIGASSYRYTQAADNFIKLQTLIGLTQQQREEAEKETRKISDLTNVSMVDLSDAAFDIFSAGQRGQTAYDTLLAAAKATMIGLGDVAVVADVATGAMQAYSKENLNAKDTIDIVTRAIKLGRLQPEDFAANIGNITGTTAELGISLEEISGMVASISLVNKNVPRAITGLDAMLRTITGPTPESIKGMEKLGTSIDEIRQITRDRGLMDTLLFLKERAGGDFLKLIEAKVFVDSEAKRTLAMLLGGNQEATIKILADMGAFRGTVEQGVRIIQQSNEFAMRRTKNQGDLTVSFIGKAANEALGEYSETASRIWSDLNEFLYDKVSEEGQKALGSFLVTGTAIIGTLGGILGSARLIDAVFKASLFAGLLDKLSLLWTGLRVGLLSAKGWIAANLLAPIAAFLGVSTGWVVGIGVAVAAAGYLVIKNWNAIWDTIREGWDRSIGALNSIWDSFLNEGVKAGFMEALTQVFEFWEWKIGIFKRMMSKIFWDIYELLPDFAKEWFNAHEEINPYTFVGPSPDDARADLERIPAIIPQELPNQSVPAREFFTQQLQTQSLATQIQQIPAPIPENALPSVSQNTVNQGSSRVSKTINIDKIEVSTQATDAAGIAQDIDTEFKKLLGDEIKHGVIEVDGVLDL